MTDKRELATRPAPKIVAFDLDDTLAPSKSPVPPEVADALNELLRRVPVCVISGGQFGQFETQLLPALHLGDEAADRLHLMPTCGTRYLRWDGTKYAEIYARNLSDEQRARAIEAVEATARDLGLWEADPWGDIIEDRGSQITFSALGQEAPLEAKVAWDMSGSKKNLLRDTLAPLLPDLEVRSGGSTSVDITARGIDKAYGIKELEKATGIGLADMLFVGDRLDEHGNDYPVKALGVACHEVASWRDTASYIHDVVARLDEDH
ncbi:HAD family hydrolase [Bowdeniella nasicola]|uniref:phosphomannomutase n=1 Tax=Bowdeniella nasicola TaxID=208480 RepID=A0A1Q5Q4L5_9ACTO|nr:HAD-IIB family hydrolase [Bowdeniella nasicola]OKL54733.1 HAD family hydrolase [Bowdeniella nasicola]